MNLESMVRIQRDSPIPLYLQLEKLLRTQIEGSDLKPGDMLPSEQELQEKFQISRTTVRQALRELEVSGLITRYRGRGTFVSQPKLTHNPDPKHGIVDQLEAAGMRPGWVLLSHGVVPAPDFVAEQLEVEPTTEVFSVTRLRIADDEPIGHLVSWVPTSVEIDRSGLTRGGSLEYLRHAADEGHVERVLEAVAAEQEIAMFLGVEPGAPMLRVRRRIRAAKGPIEVFCGTYRGDRFQYQFGGRIGY